MLQSTAMLRARGPRSLAHGAVVLRARRKPAPARNLSLWPFSGSSAPAVPSAPAPLATTEPAPEAASTTPPALSDALSEPSTTPSSLSDTSSATSDASSALPDASAILPDASSMLSVLPPEAIPASAPMHLGDCAAAGLTSMGLISFPAGLAVSFFELVHVSSGLPWFGTIIVGTALARAALFPFAVIQQRNTGKMAKFQPRLMALKEQMKRVKEKEDMVALQRLILQQREIYKQAGVSLPRMLALPFMQIPAQLGLFFGVRRLMEGDFAPVHVSGLAELVPAWADLSVPDPYYIVPAASFVLMNVAIQAFSKDMGATQDRQTVGLTLLFFRTMSVVFLPVSANFSLGLNVNIITSSALLAAQAAVLRRPAVRRALGIPLLPKKHKPWTAPTLRESVGFARQWFENKKREVEGQAMRGQGRAAKKW